MRLAVATTVAKSYLAPGRVVVDSFRQFHPDVPVFVLLTDEVDGYFDPAAENFRLLRLEDLDIPNLPRFRFNYTQQALTYAATPYLLRYLLDEGFGGAIFLKQESLVLGDLAPVFEALREHSILLTPHLLKPLRGEDGAARELSILLSGMFNLGFLGISDTPSARAFLAWWADRLYDHCRHAVGAGMHYEQRWVDLAQALFEGVHSLRDPGLNVGHWNLPEREVRLDGKNVRVDGHPARLFRFSGFEPEQPLAITKYYERLTMANVGPAAAVFERYLGLMEAAGYHETKTWPYAYGHFDNGVLVPDVARQIYRDLGDAVAEFGNPLETAAPGSFFNWLNAPVDREHGPAMVSRLWKGVYDRRPDIQYRWADILGADRRAFLAWTRIGASEMDIPARFFAHAATPVRRARLPVARQRPFGVNLVGHLASETGVGEAARGAARSLRAAGIPYVLNHEEERLSVNADDSETRFAADNPYAVNLVYLNAEPLAGFVGSRGTQYFAGRRTVGHWAWELADFPRRWESRGRYLDAVWTASSFAAEAIARVAPIPVRTAPYAIRVDAPADGTRGDFGLPEDAFVVLYMFDFGSYSERKNPMGVVEAFRRAFGEREDAVLVLKSSRAHLAPEAHAALRRAVDGTRIRLLDEVVGRERVAALMMQADCYMSLHRAEGFGLTIAEAMALGRPVIATGYSGNMEYMRQGNSFPVEYRLRPIERACGPYERGFVWAEPDLDHAAALMRLVYEAPERARAVGEQGRSDVLAALHPAVVGERMRRLLVELMDG
jgi:glycosyltransferase involved in cell wall biosynthesis